MQVPPFRLWGLPEPLNVHLDFDLAFPDDEEGRKADSRIEKLVGLSHDKYCTVSRTVEQETKVDFSIRRD